MSTLNTFLSVMCACDDAVQWIMQRLLQADLRTMQTFDLHTARLTFQDCPCPYHGTNPCDCQMIILLVYGNAMEPATLILHGNNGQTSISLAENPNQQADRKIVSDIQRALEVKVSVAISQS